MNDKKEFFPKKIADHHENPIDVLVCGLADKLCPYLHKLNFTPNLLTAIGLVIGMIGLYYYYHDNIIMAVILLWVCYFFDCLDGHFARKYDMETEFGDYFDHFRDLFILGSFIGLILYKSKNKLLALSIIGLFTALLIPHIGCQELHSNFVDKNKLLQNFVKYCKKKEYIVYTRYFGCGTYILVLSLLMISGI